MKTTYLTLLLASAGLLLSLASCSKKDAIDPNGYPCSTGNCNVTPPLFYYTIADRQGSSLLPPGSDGMSVAYVDKSLVTTSLPIVYPVTLSTSSVPLLFDGSSLASLSEAGIKTFYCTFRGKTDTLGLNIQREPANTASGGHSMPVVTFNGRPMQAVIDDPTYYILKRR